MTEIRLFDSHLHLSDQAFEEDRSAVLQRARDAGVAELVTVASDPADARRAIDLAAASPGVWATAGLHPHESAAFSLELLAELEDLAVRPEVVAIGETGLDYHYDNSPREEQRHAFRCQLQLAERTGLPVVVHSRDADEETAALISEFSGRVRGVLHCFTGGHELLTVGLDAGWFVSFSGIVTFKRYDGAEAVRRVPADRLLIETDSPYLSPVPQRGRRNEPSHLIHTCRRVADIRGDGLEITAEITRDNAMIFYNLNT
jgi:TatD DNase family protein